MTIPEILNELHEAAATAAMDLNGWDPRTLPGARNRKAEAARRAQELRVMYREAVLKGAVAIFLDGGSEPYNDAVEDMMNVALDDGTAIVIDGGKLTTAIAEAVEGSMGPSRSIGGHQLAVLESALVKEAMKLPLVELPALNTAGFNGHHAKDYSEVYEVVRKILAQSFGTQLIKIFIEHAALAEAEEIFYKQPILAVVVFGLTAEEIASVHPVLFSGVSFTIKVKEQPAHHNTLVKTFNAIKQHFNPNKSEKKGRGKKAGESPEEEE